MQKVVGNISDIDLTNEDHVRGVLKVWHMLDDFSYEYPKAKDLIIELEQRISRADLSPEQKRAMQLNLVQQYTQKEAAEEMETGTRWIAKLVTEAVVKISRVK